MATQWWKAGGATGCVFAYQPYGAASYAASLLDLSGNGNSAQEISGGLAWDTTGWLPGAGCLSSGLAVASSDTVLVQFADMVDTNADNLFGVFSNPNRIYAVIPNGAGQVEYDIKFVPSFIAPALLAGNLAIANGNGYRNGVLEATPGPGVSPTGNLYIGGRNTNGLAAPMDSGRIIAIARFAGTLSDPVIAAVASDMALIGAATPISRRAQRVQSDVDRWTSRTPAIISRYILLAGDGYSLANSWQWLDSFRGNLEELSRQSRFTTTTDVTAAHRTYLATIPRSAVSLKPAVGQQLIMRTANNEDLGRFIVNAISELRVAGDIYAYDIVLENIS